MLTRDNQSRRYYTAQEVLNNCFDTLPNRWSFSCCHIWRRRCSYNAFAYWIAPTDSCQKAVAFDILQQIEIMLFFFHGWVRAVNNNLQEAGNSFEMRKAPIHRSVLHNFIIVSALKCVGVVRGNGRNLTWFPSNVKMNGWFLVCPFTVWIIEKANNGYWIISPFWASIMMVNF